MHPFCNILIPKLFMTLAVQFHKLLSFSILGDLLMAIARMFINSLLGDTKTCKPLFETDLQRLFIICE